MRPTGDGDWCLRGRSGCPTGKTCNGYGLVTNDDTSSNDVWTFSRSSTTLSVLKNKVEVHSESNGDDTFVPFIGLYASGDSVQLEASSAESDLGAQCCTVHNWPEARFLLCV